MGKWLNRFWLLNKRLYKKATFLALLAMIPLCVVILVAAAKQESGFVRVVLAQEDKEDRLSSAIVAEFLREPSLVLFSQAEDPAQALAAVETGQADAAWIFPADMEQKVDGYADGSVRKEPILSVVEREQTIFTRLSREKLTAVLFRYCATARYISYAQGSVPGLEDTDKSALLECFHAISLSRELFAFDNAEGEDPQSVSYLLTPVRGLLAVLLCLGSCAGGLYYMQDQEKGLFSLVEEKRRPLMAVISVGIVALNLGAAVLLAVLATGISGGWIRELAGLGLYCLCCTLFALLMKEIFRSKRLYAAILPALVLALCAFCPVFFDFKKLAPVAHLFPPTYYIHFAYDSNYFFYLLLYAGALAVLWLAAQWVRKAVKKQ